MNAGLPYFTTEPLVLEPADIQPERHGKIDLYVPEAAGPFPAVAFICGGPLPADAKWIDPREWPVYRGYGALLAAAGVVAAVQHLPLNAWTDFPRAADALRQGIDFVRADPRVDPARIGIWTFCGGSPLISDWLRTPPEWLRCLAATYPALGSRPGMDPGPRFEPAAALAADRNVPPFVLTRVGREDPKVAQTVENFVAAAAQNQVELEIIDVPNGRHGFDMLDRTEESRAAVRRAVEFVIKAFT
jgi:Dienelactone hydrolase family